MGVFRYRKDITRPCVCGADECLLSETCRSFAGSSEFFASNRPSCFTDSTVPAQMFIGDGARLVRDAFELAKEKAPAIIFIDELDAIGTKRFDSDKSGDREVQRTMLELLNQLDGFSSDERIKVSILDHDSLRRMLMRSACRSLPRRIV